MVVVVGLINTTTEPVVLFNAVDGAQVYVLAPVAINALSTPLQMVLEATDTFGLGFTVTTEVAVEVPQLFVPLTV